MTHPHHLSLIVCGAPLASRAHDLQRHARAAGWDVSLTATTAAQQWLPDTPIEPATLDERVGVVTVCPLTFNTANQLAAGLNHSPLLWHLNAALATRPFIAVPMLKHDLAEHPTWRRTITVLLEAGATLIDPATGAVGDPCPIASGASEQITRGFDPTWVTRHLPRVGSTAP